MKRLVLLALVLGLVAAACTSDASTPTVTTGDPTASPTEDGSSTTTTTLGQSFAGTDPAPEFPDGLDWLNTEAPLSIAELRGKVVLLDFWTYGCINCIHIIPDLERLETEYPDELVVIGVHSAKFASEGDTENIRQIVLRYGLEHPVVNDRDFEVWQTWGANAWPTVVIIDPAGNVVGGHSGEGVYDVTQPVIASLVAEFGANGVLDRSPVSFALEADGLPETILSFPGKVLADPVSGLLYIADSNHHRIVAADPATGDVIDVFGSGRRGFRDGDARSARFDQPQGMVLSSDGA
ncbi:MAG: redoxin domain-containing protein, partial [Acidimicrobiia bacterium]|nr:redoxin domain-containing protein [Acidimicrobiia bacterium]